MKIEDIKIGDKVRLLGKHGFGDNYDNIEDWYYVNPLDKSIQKIKKQGFAYVRNIEDNGEIAVASVNEDDGEWLVLPEDLEPYQKFKIGDRVRVKNVPKGAISRTNLYMLDCMREYCGKELVITEITSQHNYETSCKFIFAEEWLELVKKEKLLLPVGTKIRQVKPCFGFKLKHPQTDVFEVVEADELHILTKDKESIPMSLTKQELEEYWEVVEDKWEDRWHSHGLVQYKVHSNGKKVKVKIASGDVGVAICADGDKFDLEKGIEIARMRAVIKHLEKQIKQLSK